MKKIAIHIILLLCFMQFANSQVEDGVVALDIPARNSLMFNRYLAHPTFSFVREQNKYITASNKRELVGVQDAPLSYLFNYSGRIKENIGAGIGVFQQNYGVLTTFGGIVNFAYNIRAQEDSNFTFGINVAAYKSGVDNGKVVVNFSDPTLDKIPSNFLLTVNPGFNYGTGFMDFGISLNNIATYNFNTSALIENNPKQGIQGHMMYTGYFRGYGFFSDSRFSALAKSEFQKDATILSGVMMLTVPKGIWAQIGYNTMYGATAGLGINLTKQIALEYNYEKPFVGLTNLGVSHEITLAYRFKNTNYYDYSRDDDVAGIFSSEYKRKKKKTVKKAIAKVPEKAPVEEEVITVEEQNRLDAENKARLALEEKVRLEKLEQAEKERIAAEEQNRLDAEKQARLAVLEKARMEAAEKERIASEEQARLETAEKERIAAEEETRLAVAEKARLVAEEQARIAALEQAKLDKEEKERIAAEEKTRLDAEKEEQARIAAEEKSRLEAENKATENTIVAPTDEIGMSISKLAAQTEESKKTQEQLLKKLEEAVVIKENDLKALKNENDLSEQNIYVEPRPFKSITAENEAIELLKINLDTVLLRQKKKIALLESLIQNRTKNISDPDDKINVFYQNALANLKVEQEKANRSRVSLTSALEQISIATDFERKRRIKRAAYDNDQDRYTQDRKMLNSLRQNVAINESSLTQEDFDFGRSRNDNIQILKNVKNTESAYYLVLAVHSDLQKRDRFLVQVISSGYKEVDFFYDVNTSEYYIYSKKFDSINEAETALKTNTNTPFNHRISIIKIEN